MDIKQKIKNLIKEALKNLKIESKEILLEHPLDLEMGDYSTNVAMVYAKQLKISPKDLAEKIVTKISSRQGLAEIEKVEVAGAGFINFYLSRDFFTENVAEILKQNEGL